MEERTAGTEIGGRKDHGGGTWLGRSSLTDAYETPHVTDTAGHRMWQCFHLFFQNMHFFPQSIYFLGLTWVYFYLSKQKCIKYC